MGQQHEIGAAVARDVDDQRRPRFRSGGLFAAEALGFEHLEMQSVPQAMFRAVIDDLHIVRPRVDQNDVGLAVSVEVARDNIGEKRVLQFRLDRAEFL